LGFGSLPLVKCYSVYFISLIGVLRVLGHGNIEIRPLIVILKWLIILIYNSVTSFKHVFIKTRSNCVCTTGLWLMHRKNYNLPVILCGCGTWFYIELQTKTEGVLEQNAKKNIWTPKARETNDLRILHNKERRGFYLPPYMIRVIKLKMR
jgi:hypothetical protein